MGAKQPGVREVSTAAGDRWEARWRDAKGRDHRRLFPTESQAVEYRRQEMEKAARGKRKLPRGIDLRPNGTYRARLLVDGRRITYHFRTLDEADRWLTDARTAQGRGLPISKPAGALDAGDGSGTPALTLMQAADAWFGDYISGRIANPKTSLKPGTIRGHRKRISRMEEYFGETNLSAVTPQMVMDFTRWMAANPYTGGQPTLQPRESGLGFNEQGTSHWIIWRTFAYARDRGWLPPGFTNPATRELVHPLVPVNPDRRGDPYQMPLDEFRAVLALLDRHDQMTALIMRLAGLRIGEVFGLRIRSVNAADRILHVEEMSGHWFEVRDPNGTVRKTTRVPWTKTPSGTRQAAMPTALAEQLAGYVLELHGETPEADAQLITGRDEAVQARTFTDNFNAACAALGILTPIDGDEANLTTPVPHDQRKSCYTDLEGWEGPNGETLDGRILSYTFGHRVPTLDGAARVSTDVYLNHAGLRRRLKRVSYAMDDLLAKALAEHGWDSIRPTSHWDDAILLAQACQILGVEEATVRRMIRRGQLDALPITGTGAGVGNPIRVSRTAAETLSAELAERIPVVDLAAHLGIARNRIPEILERSGVVMQRDEWGNGGDAGYVTPDDLATVDAVHRELLAFAEAHVDGANARRLLGVSAHITVQRLVARGVLEQVTPTGDFVELLDPRAIWLTRASVEAAAADRDAWASARRPRSGGYDPDALGKQKLLSQSQAALLLGVSTAKVELLKRAGEIERIHVGRRSWYTQRSLNAYLRKQKRKKVA